MDVNRSGSRCNGADHQSKLTDRHSCAARVVVLLWGDHCQRDLLAAHRRWHCAGNVLALPIYFANWLIFRQLFGFPANELHAGIAHLVFALFFFVIYRAAAVPPPRAEPAMKGT